MHRPETGTTATIAATVPGTGMGSRSTLDINASMSIGTTSMQHRGGTGMDTGSIRTDITWIGTGIISIGATITGADWRLVTAFGPTRGGC
jgi:hypothetical protein